MFNVSNVLLKITAKHIIRTVSIIGIGLIGVFLFYVFAFMYLSDFPSPDDIPLRKDIATELTKDFNNYQKIYEMDDATRCYKSLNEQLLSLAKSSNSNDSICNENRPTLEELLTKFEIDRATYLNFRFRLEQTKLREYCRTNNLNVYIVDGMFDDIWGYCYSDEQLKVDGQYYRVCNNTIQIVEDLGDKWYSFRGY